MYGNTAFMSSFDHNFKCVKAVLGTDNSVKLFARGEKLRVIVSVSECADLNVHRIETKVGNIVKIFSDRLGK